jgi:hypothetical protein
MQQVAVDDAAAAEDDEVSRRTDRDADGDPGIV